MGYHLSMTDDSHQALLRHLAEGALRLARRAAAVPAERVRWKPAHDAFSIVEHACHLRDLEIEGHGARIRRLLDEDLPVLEEIDGSAWAVQRRYARQAPDAAWEAFAAARAANVRTLRDALPVHAQRKGLFGGFGIVTLEQLAREMAAHDDAHAAELDALVRALADHQRVRDSSSNSSP
jgi:hypothetical protein